MLDAVARVLGHPVGEVEPLEGRESVFAVGSEAVVKCGTSETAMLDEWAALRVAGDLGLDPPVAPRLLGGDVEARVVVMERLSPAPSLAGLLLGDDAEAAGRGLVALARALGRLHAATTGGREFEVRRASLGPTPSVRHRLVRRLPSLLARAQSWTADVGLACPPGLGEDLARVGDAITRPGPYLALVHGDACPDNNRIYGNRAVLLDFQVAAVDHCLLDGSFFAVPFPTCWCVADLDATAAEAAYRAELARAVPEVADDGCWWPALAEASAFWFLLRGITGLRSALDEDEDWGTATMAQRLVVRSRRFAALARKADVLPALAEVADQVVDVLEQAMPDLPAMPVYPALARPGQAVVAAPEWWDPAP